MAFAVCVSLGTGSCKAKPCRKERTRYPCSCTLGCPRPPSRAARHSHAASWRGVAPYCLHSVISENIFSFVNTDKMTPETGGIAAFRRGLGCKGH